ncbi:MULTISPECIES: hypothetical protein [Acetobacter]|nr:MULTISPECIES: hypothetical protein [Acetobacter]
MRDRSRAEVEQKLRDIGINSSLVSRVAAGAGRVAKRPESSHGIIKISSI